MKRAFAIVLAFAFASGAFAAPNVCPPGFDTCAAPASDGAFLLATRPPMHSDGLSLSEGLPPEVDCGLDYLLCERKCAQEYFTCGKEANDSLPPMRCYDAFDGCANTCMCLD